MDYQSEHKRLSSGGNYWKPKAGQHKVLILSELIETDPFIRTKDDGTKEEQPQYKLLIKVNDEDKSWTFGRGMTLASTYGQLVDIATGNNNSLTGLSLTVIVKSDGTKNDFTIIKS